MKPHRYITNLILDVPHWLLNVLTLGVMILQRGIQRPPVAIGPGGLTHRPGPRQSLSGCSTLGL